MTATDDEREALATVLASAYNASPYRDAHLRGADAILAAGYHRQEPITDAQVEAALGVWLHNEGLTDHDDMRAALEAARDAS
jgi:hypothetical protein